MASVDPPTWRHLGRPELGVSNSISERIRNEEWKHPGLLSAVNRGHTLLVTSDYGGDHSNCRFYSYSFLLADLAYLWHWHEERARLRQTVLRDGRRLSYHRVQSDSQRARALVPFLRAANSIPGLLITFLIDKRIRTMFSGDIAAPETAAPIDVRQWSPRTLERLQRVTHLGSLVISGLVGINQNVLWISDRDEIVPNDARHIEACRLMSYILSCYVSVPIGRLRFGTTRSDDGSRSVEDLASLPDLAAGALADVVTSMVASGPLGSDGILSPMSRSLPEKTQALAAWLGDSSYTLKKIAFIIEHDSATGFQSKLMHIAIDGPIQEYNPYPALARKIFGVPRI